MKCLPFRIATLAILTFVAAPYTYADEVLPRKVLARDAFVTALLPCLEQFQEPGSDLRYQIILDQGWTATLFSIADVDGGGLGTDLCGELGGGGLEFGGAYTWPDSMGELKAVSQAIVTPDLLDLAIANAREKISTRAPVRRISISAVEPAGAHLIRVQFATAEAGPNAVTSVDLNAQGVVVSRNTRIPDQFPRKAEADRASKALAEALAAPSVDPRQALALLFTATQAKPDATVLRLTLSSFSAGLTYRNGSSGAIRETQFSYVNWQAGTVSDEATEFPPAFKACAMSVEQTKNSVNKVVLQKRYQATAKRLPHLILECSDDQPKPHWMLTALEPFEFFYLPAE